MQHRHRAFEVLREDAQHRIDVRKVVTDHVETMEALNSETADRFSAAVRTRCEVHVHAVWQSALRLSRDHGIVYVPTGV